jgi:hypothetical protein
VSEQPGRAANVYFVDGMSVTGDEATVTLTCTLTAAGRPDEADITLIFGADLAAKLATEISPLI